MRLFQRIPTLQQLALKLSARLALAGILLAFPSQSKAIDGTGGPTNAAPAAFDLALHRYLRDTNSAEAAWEFGRACFDAATTTLDKPRKAEVAERGIVACRAAISRQTNSAPAHYYLGMNLGQLADTKRNLAGLRMVKEMEREFQAAADLDETFDFAGPDRNLGLLYLQAPAFISVGSKSKARQQLRRAVELAPTYPENRLCLIEAEMKWNDLSGAARELHALDDIWPAARRQLAGDRWTSSWTDWENRLSVVRRKLNPAGKKETSP